MEARAPKHPHTRRRAGRFNRHDLPSPRYHPGKKRVKPVGRHDS